MWDDLLIGLFAIATGFGLLMLGLPNRRGESPRFLQGSSSRHALPAGHPGISCRGNCRIDRLGCDDAMVACRVDRRRKMTQIRRPFSTSRAEVSSIWRLTATAGGRA